MGERSFGHHLERGILVVASAWLAFVVVVLVIAAVRGEPGARTVVLTLLALAACALIIAGGSYQLERWRIARMRARGQHLGTCYSGGLDLAWLCLRHLALPRRVGPGLWAVRVPMNGSGEVAP